MKQQKDNELDNKLASLLKDHQVEPPADIWAAIDKELLPQKGKKIGAWMWAAASLAAILIVAGILFFGKMDKQNSPIISANVPNLDSGKLPHRSPTIIIRSKTNDIMPTARPETRQIIPSGKKDSVHNGFEFKAIKQPIELRKEMLAETKNRKRKTERLKPLDQKYISALKMDASSTILAKNRPKATINNEKIVLEVIIEDDRDKKLNINNLSFVNAVNALASKLDRSEDKFLHLEKGENSKKIKGFSLDIVNLTISYNAKD